MCRRCAVTYLRSALGDAQTQVTPEGVRCPMHPSGCSSFISAADASRLLTPRDAEHMAARAARSDPLAYGAAVTTKGIITRWLPAPLTSKLHKLAPDLYAWSEKRLAHLSQTHGWGLDEPPPTFLTMMELRRLRNYEVEATIPTPLRAWCPRCHLVHRRPPPAPPPPRWRRVLLGIGLLRPPGEANLECEYCGCPWDARAGRGDANYDERASAALIALTTRQCPNPACKQRVSHFHGHACHQISPYTNGCPSCHLHFCYVCRLPHGVPGSGYQKHLLCTHGSSFCNNRNILANLVREPYPHDRRCGCPVCPLCAKGRPCEQCDGTCIVCDGVVPTGPTQLSAAALDMAERKPGILSRCIPAGFRPGTS